MKKIEIFRHGRQTASSGESLSFTEEHLRKSVEAYDPKLHEAPIVVGHPKDNAPAYGWIKSMEYGEDGLLHGLTDQVMPEFAEMVQAGRFKKRSASFYKPDSPANPVPGTYYLRHVGFLGAQPPAVKGLADPEFKEGKVPEAVEFSDTPDDVIEFADDRQLATIFRRMREFFIDRFGSETADQVLPGFFIEDMEEEARRQAEATDDPAFRESGNNQPGGKPMPLTEQEIADLQAKAKRADDLETEVASYKQKETDFAEREKKLKRAEIEKSVDALIEEGKVLPTERENTINYVETLDDSSDSEIEFKEGEGDKAETKKLSQRAYFLNTLAKRPPVVDFKERSADSGSETDTEDYAEVAEEAKAYRNRELQNGRHLTASQAVAAVKAGKHKTQ